MRDELVSTPPIPCAENDARAPEAEEPVGAEGMGRGSGADSSFVYCDVCRDTTDEERQLAAVMEIANAINSKLDLDQILSTISRELSKVIECDIGCVAIYDRDKNGLFMRHVWRKTGDKSGEGRYVPLEETNLIGWVALHRKPVVRADILADARFREIMREDGLQSDIVVPLMAKDTLIGTVNVGSYERGRFTDFDLDLVVRFSNLTSIAIEKCQLLQELSALGEKYRLLMKNSKEVIALLNASGEYVEVNQAIFRNYGYTPQEVLGQEFLQFVVPDRRAEAKQNFCSILKGEADRLAEMPYLKKNGEIIYMDIGASVIRIDGHPYVLAIAHDVTESKMLQEQITVRNTELVAINTKLRQRDDLKNEFLGRISHELRTPLSVIMAYTSTLLEDRDQTIDPETRSEFLRVIDVHSNKLLGLINDLLDLSRVEVSKTMLHKSEGSLNEIIRISARMAEAFAAQNRVSISLDLDETIPIIAFDPLRIRQACVNLINNAVKFSREGDSVSIASRNGAAEVAVSVSDHGAGIEEGHIPELFEKFCQIDGGPTREKDGLGIGLKLVKHYVELHGGRVWVASQKEKGSTFSFSLPK